MAKNSLKGEFWFIFGGLGLIIAGLFIFLPIWVAIHPGLPFIDVVIVVVSMVAGFALLVKGFARYRYRELKEVIDMFLRTR